MSEKREGIDPMREARTLGLRIVERMNAEKGATRKDILHEHMVIRGTLSGETVGVSLAAGEKYREDGNEHDENGERNRRRKACMFDICTQLEKRGTPLPEDLQIVLAVVMEHVAGNWNDYDGDEEGIALGTVEFNALEKVVTIRFESFGENVGKNVIRLALT